MATWRPDPTFYPSRRIGYEELVRDKTYGKSKENKR
jgi:hypothetical protein